MAFEGIKIQGAEKLNKFIRKNIKKVKNPIKFYARASILLFQDVQRHFQKEESPEGAWKDLSPITLARRRKAGAGAKKLRDTGRLFGSIKPIYTSNKAEVGTNLIYASTHQVGRGKIPARPFIWMSKEAEKRILNQFMGFLAGKVV